MILGSTRNRANYPGDVADAVMSDRAPFGPDLDKAYYTPVSATYDAAAGVTRVQFQPIPRSNRPKGMPLMEELTRQQRRQYERIGKKLLAQKGHES